MEVKFKLAELIYVAIPVVITFLGAFLTLLKSHVRTNSTLDAIVQRLDRQNGRVSKNEDAIKEHESRASDKIAELATKIRELVSDHVESYHHK